MFRFILFSLAVSTVLASTLAQSTTTVIYQDFAAARQAAAEQDKTLLIDFYTSWCQPCKQIDSALFRDPQRLAALGDAFVVLKYNAEQDSVYHIAKKYHINNYPSALVLNSAGQVVDRVLGFVGDTGVEMAEELIAFSLAANDSAERGAYLKGYSTATPVVSDYPSFYVDYVERRDLRSKKRPEFEAYFLDDDQDRLHEAYYATLIYFVMDISDEVLDRTLSDLPRYRELYHLEHLNSSLYLASWARFSRAIKAGDEAAFTRAERFAEAALDAESCEELVIDMRQEFEDSLAEG